MKEALNQEKGNAIKKLRFAYDVRFEEKGIEILRRKVHLNFNE